MDKKTTRKDLAELFSVSEIMSQQSGNVIMMNLVSEILDRLEALEGGSGLGGTEWDGSQKQYSEHE
jgi:hypothetical protein